LLHHTGLSESMFHIMDATRGANNRLRSMFDNIIHLSHLRTWDLGSIHSGKGLKDSVGESIIPKGHELLNIFPSVMGRLGQLSLKHEAAGKVRVFAMVDIWTQSVLKPVHDSISEILKSLPNDGTFDQGGAVERCFAKAKIAGYSYGYDLSAATDRLPIKLQRELISALYNSTVVGSAWSNLLVGREYLLEGDAYSYAVGQPMGALSSFNMLALTHHMIVQYCAVKSHVARLGVWWDGYELLGDDIVIFDSKVSVAYLDFMKKIGMEINEKKSVIARNETFEFAKVTGHNGHNVSAVSWKMFISQNSFIGRANIAFSLLRKRIGRPGL